MLVSHQIDILQGRIVKIPAVRIQGITSGCKKHPQAVISAKGSCT